MDDDLAQEIAVEHVRWCLATGMSYYDIPASLQYRRCTRDFDGSVDFIAQRWLELRKAPTALL